MMTCNVPSDWRGTNNSRTLNTILDALNDIRQIVAQFRRGLHRRYAAEGVIVALLSILCLGTICVLAAWVVDDHELSVLQIAGLACGVFICVVSAGAYAFIPWLRFRDDREVARRLNYKLPELHDGVLSVVELSKGRATGTSQALVEALAVDTSRRLKSIDMSALISWQRVRRIARILAIMLGLILGCFFIAPEPFSEGAHALVTGQRELQVERPGVDVVQRDVVVGDIHYRLVFPAYTGMNDRVLKNSGGDLEVLTGTKIKISTRALELSKQADLVFSNGEPALAMEIASEDQLKTELTALNTMRFHFELTRFDGTRFVERARRIIEVLPDQAPAIELLEPKSDLEVQNDDPVTLYFSAADDFGIGGIDIVTQKNEEGARPVTRRVPGFSSGQSYVGEALLDLRELGMQPGESITCWLEVYDNNTVAESPIRTRSKAIVIKIFSAAEKHNELIGIQRQLVDAMLDLLGDRLESPIEQQTLSRYDSLLDAQGAITASAGKLELAMKTLLEELRQDTKAQFEILADLEEILKRHQQLNKRESKQVKDALGALRVSQRSSHLDTLFRTNEAATAELEQDILHLDKLIDQQHQSQVVEKGKALVGAQRELSQLLEKYKKTGDDALKMEIQRKLARLLKQIDSMRREIAKNAKPSPYENMNRDGMTVGEEQDRLSQMQTKVTQLQEMLRNGDMAGLSRMIEQVGRDIQTMVTGMESKLVEMNSAADGKSRAKLRKVGWELNKAIHRQDTVNRETDKLSQSMRERLSRLVQRKLAPEIARELEKIQQLSKRVARVDPKAMHTDDATRLKSLKSTLQNLRETLSQEDIGQALQIAGSLHKGLYELQLELERGIERMEERHGDKYRLSRRRNASRRIRNVVPAARRIHRSLKALMPEPKDLLDGKEVRRLERLSERQRRVVDRVQRLRKQIQKLDVAHPGVGAQLESALQEAQEAMRGAAKRLGEHQPSKALGHERVAKEKLAAARRKLEQALGRDAPGSGGRMAGRDPRDKVAIPDADRYNVPKEFRDELLRAYKEKAPQRYRNLIEKYYEALVR